MTIKFDRKPIPLKYSKSWFMKLSCSKIRKLVFAIAVVSGTVLFTGTQTSGQTIVDKTVATVSDGVRTELITYSDLMWQLALRPGVSLATPSSENLNIALQLIINQRVIALEAERLPRAAPTEDEIKNERSRVLGAFPFDRRV